MKKIIFLLLFLSFLKILFADAIKCAYCHKPIKKDYIEYNGKYYHKSCFYNHVVPRCSICGKPIKGKYLKNFWGDIYHPYHEKNLKKCEYCNRLIKNTPSPDENGFYVCKQCKRKEISDLYQAKDLIKRINSMLYYYGIDIDLSIIQINIATLKELKHTVKDAVITSDQKGLAEYKIIKNGAKTKKIYKIYILKDMPDFVFAEVAAHELMHIWIYINGAKDQQLSLVEGSCNYAAYLVLNKITKKNPFRMINITPQEAEFQIMKLNKNPDPIYGKGYRTIKKYAEKYGIFMWLSYLKHHKNLPENF